MSFKMLLILSSYRVLKATTEPEQSLTRSPIKPCQPKWDGRDDYLKKIKYEDLSSIDAFG
jgi:hypothetical protein